MRTPTSTARTIVHGAVLALALATAGRAEARDWAAPALSGDRATPGLMVEEPPRYGMFYDEREPSFYTGFAPRSDDPGRVHIHLGRGNQLRVTVVLAYDVLRDYARDLQARLKTYRRLTDEGRIELTQNLSFEAFAKKLDEVGIDRLVAEEPRLSPEGLRTRNLDLLARLNPGRVFRIAIPVRAAAARWIAELTPADRTRLDDARRLELANLLLPTRLWLAELPADVRKGIDELVRRAPASSTDAPALDAFAPAYTAALDRVGAGRYPTRDGVVQFDEFTAIYPVGTVHAYTTWRGRQIPQYPTPGRRALTTHQRSLTADHIPIDDSYSYSPWLPYMHVGPTMHDSIHTPWWKMAPSDASFLPPAWSSVDRGSRDGTPFTKLWLLSRGPMSHGCTHLNTGHIAELRQMLPADSNRLYEVDVHLTRSEHYDVFDIDGDLTPEVIGVRYFIAYSLKGGKPERLRVRNERRAFYDWLYAGDLGWEGDQGVFQNVQDARFVGRDARAGRMYEHVRLYEAGYEPESVQFYRLITIPFARALRQVTAHGAPPELFATRTAKAPEPRPAGQETVAASMSAPAPRPRAGWWVTALLFGVVTVGTDLALARAYRSLVPPVDFRAIERTYRRAADPYHHGLAPNVDLVGAWGDRRYPLRTNALGFKDAACRSVALAPTGRRVLLIGDSFTEGVGFPFEETFAGRIAAALSADGTEVLNAAAVSYAPSIYDRKVRHLIEDVGLGFDELVVFLDVSDVNDEATMYRVDADDRVVATSEIGRLWIGDAPAAPAALDDWLVERSIVARAVRTAWRSARGTPVCPGTDRDPLTTVTNVEAARWSFDDAAFAERGARGLAQATAAMDRLDALLRRHGRALTVVVYPWPDHVLRRDLDSRQVTAWRDWAARREVRFIDLFPAFIDGEEPAAVIARDYIPCDVHFSAVGHRRVAEAFLAARSRSPTP